MVSKRKKKKQEALRASFGQLKDDDFDFSLIILYFEKKDHSSAFQVLSDKTCTDLDFEELFMFLDRTNSKIGQQYLYNKLRALATDQKITDEKLIQLFSNDTAFRVSVQEQLSRLNNTNSYYVRSLFQEDHTEPPKWFFVIRLLSFTSVLTLALLPFTPQLFLVLLAVVVANLLIHYWNKRNLYQYLASIPELLKLNRVARELYNDDRLKVINPQLPESIRIIEQVKNRMSFFKLEANLDGDLQAIFWGFLELFKILFLMEPLLLFNVLKKLDTKRKQIEDVFLFVGHIDTLISISSLRQGLPSYCLPIIHKNNNELIVENVYHPLIPYCITNSISVKGKSILLTGSNMSGKTTFIRTIGINTLTGQALNTCFADSFLLPKLRIFSAIRISDDLMNDKSYYFEEVLTIKEMIDESQTEVANLFLLDEIYKGTNTVERISAGKAVLSFISQNNNIVFVSTHDIELTDLLEEEYELYHFSEIVEHNTVDFDYQLKIGKLTNRNAIRILQINNYPEKVIKEAIDISKELDKTCIYCK